MTSRCRPRRAGYATGQVVGVDGALSADRRWVPVYIQYSVARERQLTRAKKRTAISAGTLGAVGLIYLHLVVRVELDGDRFQKVPELVGAKGAKQPYLCVSQYD